jgi:hypothetical protein
MQPRRSPSLPNEPFKRSPITLRIEQVRQWLERRSTEAEQR